MLDPNFWNFYHYPEVDSTMDVARKLIAPEDNRPLVVLADRQNAGRGRQGQVWQNTATSLMLTIVVPAEGSIDYSAFPLVVGLSIVKALGATPDKLLLKWPNDILTPDGLKVAGILLETATVGGRKYLLIGCGINLKINSKQLTKDLKISSLYDSLGFNYQTEDILLGLISNVNDDYQSFNSHSFEYFREEWLRYSFLAEKLVHARVQSEELTLKCLGVNSIGQLLVDQDGVQRELSSAEIFGIKNVSS